MLGQRWLHHWSTHPIECIKKAWLSVKIVMWQYFWKQLPCIIFSSDKYSTKLCPMTCNNLIISHSIFPSVFCLVYHYLFISAATTRPEKGCHTGSITSLEHAHYCCITRCHLQIFPICYPYIQQEPILSHSHCLHLWVQHYHLYSY